MRTSSALDAAVLEWSVLPAKEDAVGLLSLLVRDGLALVLVADAVSQLPRATASWDQPAHAIRSWENELLLRLGDSGGSPGRTLMLIGRRGGST